jgi:uncharacterized protein (TIGR02246 family)
MAQLKWFWLVAGVSGISACAQLPASVQAEAPCQPVTEAEIAALFEGWNAALQSGDPAQVVARYAPHSLLLPTLSNTPRLTAAEKYDYFEHFLAAQPLASVHERFIELGCNQALDAGLYTFGLARTGGHVHARYTFSYRWDGEQWLITHHHSSLQPESVGH